MNTKHVVVLIGADIDPNSLLRAGSSSPLGDYKGRVTVIATKEPSEVCIFPLLHLHTDASWGNRTIARLGFATLGRVLMRYPIGRLVNSLSPYDQSRVFNRAVRRDSTAVDLISTATLLVAADLPSVRLAWTALHSGIVPRAIYTLAAAKRELSED